MLPPQSVEIQFRIFTPVGTAISRVAMEKAESATGPMPDREHVMAPHAEPEEADQDARVDHHGGAEERLPREGREHLGDDAHGGQDQDVDLGVPEDPEQVLPQERVAARRGHVEERAEEAVEHQQDEGDGDGGEGEDEQELRHEAHPDEHRHAHQGHARCARMLTMVTMKLKPASMDEMPRICRPSIQKSMLWVGENCALDKLA